MSRPQRRKQFVDSHVQGALVRRILFHWTVFLLVSFVVSFLLQVLSNPFRPLSEQIQQLWGTHGPFLLVVVFMLPVFMIDTIKISQRFAGPIFSLRRAMQNVASGEAPRPIKFREDDFWPDLAEDYNAMLRQLAPSAMNGQAGEEEKQSVGTSV